MKHETPRYNVPDPVPQMCCGEEMQDLGNGCQECPICLRVEEPFEPLPSLDIEPPADAVPDPENELVRVQLLECVGAWLPRRLVRIHRLDGAHIVQSKTTGDKPRIFLSAEQRRALEEHWQERNPRS